MAGHFACRVRRPWGLPPGLAGCTLFRTMRNSAVPDERPEVLGAAFEKNDVVAAVLKATGTHPGELG
jgi:hypothetical protein